MLSQVKCTSCSEVHPKLISMNKFVSGVPLTCKPPFIIMSKEERPISGASKGTANFVWRCGTCKRESSAKFDPKFAPQPYTADSNGQFAPLLTVECRGLEFIEFDPRVRLVTRRNQPP